jgi:hypothetical protein
MLVRRLTTVVALVLLVSVIGDGAFLIYKRSWADEKPAKKAPPAEPVAQNQVKLKALLTERRKVAKRQLDAWKNRAISYLADARAEKLQKEKKLKGVNANPLEGKEIRLWSLMNPLHVSDIQLHLYQWAQRLLTAELELADKQADRVAVYEAHVLRLKELEEEFKKMEQAFKKEDKEGQLNVYSAEAAFHRLQAQIMLEREKGR